MSEATAGAGAPLPKDTTATTPEAESKAEKHAARESARRYVRGIVDDRMSIVSHRVDAGKENPSDFSAGDKILFFAAELGKGLPLSDRPEGIALSEDGSGMSVTFNENGTERTVKVLLVTDQKTETGQNRLTGEEQQRATFYTCVIDGDPDPIEIPAPDIQTGFLASNTSLIAESYPSDETLLTWGLRDADNTEDIPPAVDEALRREADPATRTNRILDIRFQQLQVNMKGLEGKDLKEAERLLAELEYAMKSNGSELGAWAKMKGLKALEDVGVDTSQLQSELQPEADKAKQLLDQLLEGTKMSDKEKAALDSKDLPTILADKGLLTKLLAIDGLKEMLFGDTPDSELGDLAKKFLTSEQLQQLQDEHGSSWWKVMLLITAGIVSAPALGLGAAGVATGLTIPQAAKGAFN